MNRYVDFSIVTKEALEYSCQILHIKLSAAAEKELMHSNNCLYKNKKIHVTHVNLNNQYLN